MPRAHQQRPLGRRAALHAVLAQDLGLELHLRAHGVLNPQRRLVHVLVQLGVAGDEELAQLRDAVGIGAGTEAAEDHLVAVQAPIGAAGYRGVDPVLGVGDHH